MTKGSGDAKTAAGLAGGVEVLGNFSLVDYKGQGENANVCLFEQQRSRLNKVESVAGEPNQQPFAPTCSRRTSVATAEMQWVCPFVLAYGCWTK